MLYLHGQKILHRDLALRNLLATDSKESDYKFLVKVADFGNVFHRAIPLNNDIKLFPK